MGLLIALGVAAAAIGGALFALPAKKPSAGAAPPPGEPILGGLTGYGGASAPAVKPQDIFEAVKNLGGGGGGKGGLDLGRTVGDVVKGIPQVTGIIKTAGTEAISLGATVGLSASAVCGVAVIIADLLIVLAVAIDYGGSEIKWTSQALEAGESGMRSRLVDYAVELARSTSAPQKDPTTGQTPPPIDKVQAAIFGAHAALAYNEAMRLMVYRIPRGHAFVSDDEHNAYWRDRAMFVDDAHLVGFEGEVFGRLGVTGSEVGATHPGLLFHATMLGRAMGKLQCAWMHARKSMLMDWHYRWTCRARGEWFGNFTLGAWDGGIAGKMLTDSQVPGVAFMATAEDPNNSVLTPLLQADEMLVLDFLKSDPSIFAVRPHPHYVVPTIVPNRPGAPLPDAPETRETNPALGPKSPFGSMPLYPPSPTGAQPTYGRLSTTAAAAPRAANLSTAASALAARRIG